MNIIFNILSFSSPLLLAGALAKTALWVLRRDGFYSGQNPICRLYSKYFLLLPAHLILHCRLSLLGDRQRINAHSLASSRLSPNHHHCVLKSVFHHKYSINLNIQTIHRIYNAIKTFIASRINISEGLSHECPVKLWM